MPSYATNTDILDQYLQANEDDDDGQEGTMEMDLEMCNGIPRRNLKRKREVFDEIVVRRGPPSH
jgi:hypothetical protein